ncbi:MAG: ribosome rescue GTPase HflX [Granulosicoccaceae bacterium]
MFERHGGGSRALLVNLDLGREAVDEGVIQEFEELATSAGAEVVDVVRGSRDKPDSRLFVGSGKAQEIADRCRLESVDLVIFNHSLSPSQERNLEQILQCRVLDRTGLILDIFSQRARSHEGKLQVELAQLRHLSTRLVRGWTHLERQKGGIGLRGPGETQLETDRRLLAVRIKRLRKDLDEVRQRRELNRAARQRAQVATVSLVGYTNAGKSTLFNALTNAGVYAADRLFATLDPTLRKLELFPGLEAVIVDTVGFVSDLPHELVEAFHATLQESAEATLLLRVVDSADPRRAEFEHEVDSVLEQVGATEVPSFTVYNKVDLRGEQPRIDRDEEGRVTRVWLSSLTGEGLDLLHDAVVEYLAVSRRRGELQLNASQGKLRASLYQLGAIVEESVGDSGEFSLQVDVDEIEWQRLAKRGEVELEALPLWTS